MVKDLKVNKADKDKMMVLDKKQHDMNKQIDEIMNALLAIHKALDDRKNQPNTSNVPSTAP